MRRSMLALLPLQACRRRDEIRLVTGRFWLNPGNRGGGSSTDPRCATKVCPGSVPPQRVPDGHGSGPIGSRVSPKAHWLKSVSNGNEEVFSESFSYRKLLEACRGKS